MTEAGVFAVTLKALPPTGALLLGLCLGGVVVIISRLVLQTHGTTAKARSLHIELREDREAQQRLERTTAEADDYAPALQSNSRRWQLEEVWVDEGMGTN